MNSSNEPKLVTVGQLFELGKSSADRWTVDGFLRLGDLVVLGGDSKAGKSMFATHLAFAVERGEPFLGMPTFKSPVIWLTFEESESERYEAIRHYNGANHSICYNPLPINTQEGISLLRKWIVETGAKLVVIDALTGAVDCDNLSEPRKARAALTPINDLRRTLDVTVVILHHNNKMHALSDSHQIRAIASHILEMSHKKRPTGRIITLKGDGRGEHANKDWKILSRGVADYELMSDSSPAEKKLSLRDRFLSLLSASPEPVLIENAASELRANRRTLENLVGPLVKEGMIVSAEMTGARAKGYKVVLPLKLAA